MIHDGHPGFRKTYARLKQRFCWPNMKRECREFVSHCKVCLERKAYAEAKKTLQLDIRDKFSEIYMDLKDFHNQPSGQFKFVLVILDGASRWVELIPLENKTPPLVAEMFYEQWICRYGLPKSIRTDLGKEFINKVMKELTLVTNIDHIPARLNHHDDIGRVERFMRTLQESLNVIALAKKGNWHESLQHVAYT
jgi:hypothetical protein